MARTPNLGLGQKSGLRDLSLDVSHLGSPIFTHSSVHLEPVLPVPDPQNLGLFPSSRSFARLELPVLVAGLAHFGFIYHLLVLSSLHLDFSSSSRSSVHPGASTLASGLASFDLSLFLQGGVRLESAILISGVGHADSLASALDLAATGVSLLPQSSA